MSTQSDLYLEIPNLTTVKYVKSVLVRNFDEINRFGLQRTCKNDLVIDYSPDINSIAKFLTPRVPDEQWVRREVEMSGCENQSPNEEQIKDAYRRLRGEVFYYNVFAELQDWEPQKRIHNYQLPKGKNSVLYRQWKAMDEEDRVSPEGLNPIPVRWLTKKGSITNSMARFLDAHYNTYVWAKRENDKFYSDGLNILEWRFSIGEPPELDSSNPGQVDKYNSGNKGLLIGKK